MRLQSLVSRNVIHLLVAVGCSIASSITLAQQPVVMSPGQRLLRDCELLNKQGLTDLENLGRVTCLTLVLYSLSYYRAESLSSMRHNQEVLKTGKGQMREIPSGFCYSVSDQRRIEPIEASEEVQGFSRYLRAIPASALASGGPADDVEMRLLRGYFQHEYPCDEYYRTFGFEAKKHRPRRPLGIHQ